LQGLEHVLIHGGHFGTEAFNTYLDMSGCEGHSVFNMYLVISGIGGQGGTVDLNTYFERSVSDAGGMALFIESGPTLSITLEQAHLDFDIPHSLHEFKLGFAIGVQPQSIFGLSQTLQGHSHFLLGMLHTLHDLPYEANPSFVFEFKAK
jgi:hypothetical protein